MRKWINIVSEAAGLIVQGVNTTPDVGVNQTEIEAAKLGFKIGKNGPPVFRFGRKKKK